MILYPEVRIKRGKVLDSVPAYYFIHNSCNCIFLAGLDSSYYPPSIHNRLDLSLFALTSDLMDREKVASEKSLDTD